MEIVEIECRCSECKYSEIVAGYHFMHCYYWEYEQGSSPNKVEPSGFCSEGELKCVKK